MSPASAAAPPALRSARSALRNAHVLALSRVEVDVSARHLLGPLLSAVAFAATVAPAGACSYAVPPDYDPIRDPFDAADIAITGRVTRVKRPHSDPGQFTATTFVATIRISRVYKGKTGPALRIRGNDDEGLCGFGTVKRGEHVAVLLHGRRTPFAVTLFDRTTYRDLEKVTHGRSHRPGRM
jgi:hypothetical protein